MKKLIFTIRLINFILLLQIMLGSCSSSMALNSANKTTQLHPGMKYSEVVTILGEPKASEIRDNQLVARWVLQEMWVGYIPYDMVFNSKNRELISWSKNEKDFQKRQENLKAFATVLEETTAGSSGSGNASVNGPNDANLQQQFAVKLYKYSGGGYGSSGGTETIISFCPDGRFFKSGESSYSGDGWGSASQGGETGRWRIQGNMQSGKITIIKDGKAWEYPYKRVEGDYVSINGDKYGINGSPSCN
jgi:hypothetical protein